MDFKTIKFDPQNIYSIVADQKKGFTPTPKQISDAMNVLSKDDYLALTVSDVEKLVTIIEKYSNFSAAKLGAGAKTVLAELYAKIMYGVVDLPTFDEFSNRRFQRNGIKSEKNAIEILSRLDGVLYEKNKERFQNDYFEGIPDIIDYKKVIEIKTVATLPGFIQLANKKSHIGYEYQLQCYLDLLDFEIGEIVYVLTGLCQEEKDRYLSFARDRYTEMGWSSERIDNKLLTLERSVDFSHVPDEKRVIRKEFKRDKYMIRLAKKKVTAARHHLEKIHEKFNKDVFLGNGNESHSPEDL